MAFSFLLRICGTIDFQKNPSPECSIQQIVLWDWHPEWMSPVIAMLPILRLKSFSVRSCPKTRFLHCINDNNPSFCYHCLLFCRENLLLLHNYYYPIIFVLWIVLHAWTGGKVTVTYSSSSSSSSRYCYRLRIVARTRRRDAELNFPLRVPSTDGYYTCAQSSSLTTCTS